MWLYSCINIFLIGGVINIHFKAAISNTYETINTRLKLKERIKKLLRIRKQVPTVTEAIEKDKAINS